MHADWPASSVLVVDDHAATRELVRYILQEHGYHVLTAPDAESALLLRKAHQGPIELMISDIQMPGMQGEALADVIEQRYPETKILLMTGLSLDAITVRWRHAGIRKPFTPDDLLRRVEEALEVAIP